MRYCMFCGNPMEDDDLFCTSCGKAIVDDADDSSAKKSAASEMMAEDATITSTRHMRNPNEAAGAGMAAGAAYGAGHAYGPDSPAGMRPESNAYGHAPAGGAGGGEYGRAAAGGAGYGAGRPASNGGGYKTSDPGRNPADSGGKKKSSKSPMYGNPHVDSAIESSRRGRKADASRLIMLATAAVLILILGALLFMLGKPVKSDEDEKEENPVAVLDESGKEDEKLNQGQQQTASGQAAGDDQGAQNQSAGDSQAAQNQDAHAKEAEEAEKPEEHESQQVAAASADAAEDNAAAQQDSGENTAAAVEVGDSAPAQQQNDNGSVQTQEKEPAAAENSSGGWTTDEDGNEVYYAGNGEENTDYDQTGTPSSDDEYILPDSDKRYYTREELNKLSDYDLQMAINEIYARHGRKFDTESIRKYFESKSWYHGTIAPADFDGNESKYFNAYETANRELMIQIRDQRGANLQW